MKIHPVRFELLHSDRGTDRQTDMTKLIVIFRNFADAPKNPSDCRIRKMSFSILRYIQNIELHSEGIL
jgi:hypothetical protein